jgi:hypothetical protein
VTEQLYAILEQMIRDATLTVTICMWIPTGCAGRRAVRPERRAYERLTQPQRI